MSTRNLLDVSLFYVIYNILEIISLLCTYLICRNWSTCLNTATNVMLYYYLVNDSDNNPSEETIRAVSLNAKISSATIQIDSVTMLATVRLHLHMKSVLKISHRFLWSLLRHSHKRSIHLRQLYQHSLTTEALKSNTLQKEEKMTAEGLYLILINF